MTFHASMPRSMSRPDGPLRCVLVWQIACWMAWSAPVQGADKVWSIQRLNADKERWNERIDVPMKVEGRVSAVSKRQFRFVQCELTFHVSEDQSRTIGAVRNVEVSGRIKKDQTTGKLVFAVERVKSLPTDLEQFDAKELKLKSTKAADWYELAEWAASRGKFYGDEELAAKSRRAEAKGIQFERIALPEDDADARFALAKKIEELELDMSWAAELIHEAARLRWQAAKDDTRQREQFAAWLKTVYPKSGEPQETLPAPLNQSYAAHPVETFHAADEPTRLVLQRLFAIQVEVARILPLAKEDGSNAVAIADALADKVPERHDLISRFRDAAFQWRLKSIATATQAEALRLAEELKSIDDTGDESRKLLRSWIASREDRLRKDGQLGLMQLAEDYLQLVNDEPKAVAYLAEAHQLDPSFTDPSDRLKELGYYRDQNRWIKGETPDTPSAPGKAPGQLAVGMSAEEVLSLLGVPNAKTRVLTSGGLQEVWSFGRRGTPRLLIHLKRTIAQPSPRVTQFLTEGSR